MIAAAIPHPHDIGADPAAPLVDLPGHSSRGRLERVLRRGEFAVTAELSPPDSANVEDVEERARNFEGWVDGVNATDGSGAHCHMSSVAVCAILTRIGYSPVMQISCRDYNRIAIQGNVLGAAALGVGNVLCLTGDGVQCGDQPEAKPVFDLDSISLLSVIRMMRDEGRFLSGRKLTTPPRPARCPGWRCGYSHGRRSASPANSRCGSGSRTPRRSTCDNARRSRRWR